MLIHAHRQRICITRFVNNSFALLAFVAVLLFWSAEQRHAQTVPKPDNANTAAQDKQDVRALEQGRSVTRELKGAESHSYKIALSAGQYLKTIVEQRGIDVVVRLFAPDGKQVIEVDSPNGTQGAEPISVLIETTGNYRLEVRSLEANAAAGRYEAKIEELRAATVKDRSLIVAQQAYAQGELLMAEGSADSLRKAIDKYQEALPLWRDVNDRAKEAKTLSNIGFAYSSLEEDEKALNFFNQALLLVRAVGDRNNEAVLLNNIGAVYRSLGEVQKALDYHNQALPLMQAVGDRGGEITTLNYIGLVYQSLGEMRKALDFHSQALIHSRAINDRSNEAPILNNLALLYDNLGESQKSLDYYNQALALVRDLDEQHGEATILTGIAKVYNDLGEKQKALDYYSQALPLRRAVSNRRGEAVTLNNIGLLYSELGQEQKALDHYNQALLLQRAIGDRSTEAATLNNIGQTYNALGEKQKALDFFNQALSLRRAVGDRSGEANSLNSIGVVHTNLGEWQKALDVFNQALIVSRAVRSRREEAYTLDNIGTVYRNLKEPQKALDYFNQALVFRRSTGNRSGEADVLTHIARHERDRDNFTEARAHIEEAINIVESLRTKIASQELRSSYFATVQDYYELYTDILMRLHKKTPSENYDALALQANERARARSLLELLAEARADIRQGVDSALLERLQILQRQLNSKAQQQTQLSEGKDAEEKALKIKKEIDALTTELQQVETEIRQKSPRYAALTQPQPLNLKEIQTQVLDSDTILLEYSLGEEKSYLWAVTTDSITSYELPKRAEIEAAAKSYYELLAAGNSAVKTKPQTNSRLAKEQKPIASIDAELSEAASRLSRMIIAPVAAELGTKRLLIVADGALQYIPFAALPETAANSTNDAAPESVGKAKAKTGNAAKKSVSQPIIVNHEIVSLPSASTLAVLRREFSARRPVAGTVAIVADPVFSKDDVRVGKAAMSRQQTKTNDAGNEKLTKIPAASSTVIRALEETGIMRDGLSLARLDATSAEANKILELAPVNTGMKAVSFEANRLRVTSGDLARYRIVHFATHGLLNSEHPELSGVVLSLVDERGEPQDGFLRLHEVYNLKLPAELVVLSACQTALGKEIKGEGLVGLTRGFMYAGSPRVVASLWKVDDGATQELMERFYRAMLTDKLRPAAALRRAQIEMAKQITRGKPYYWAAFVLQGEWK